MISPKGIVCIIIAGLFFFAGCKETNGFLYVEDLNIYQPEIGEDFNEIHQIIKENYSFLSDKGINPDSLYTAFFTQIQEVQNGEEYIRVLLQYFSRLQNGHTDLLFRKYIINNWAVVIDGRLYMSYVQDETFLEKGIQVKDEIVEINHVPAMQWLDQEQMYVSASTITAAKEAARLNVFQSYFPEDRHYLIRTDRGLKEVSVEFRKPEPARSGGVRGALVNSRIIAGHIGYLSVASMQNGAQEEFANAFDDMKDKPYLVIDIRNNMGGNSFVSEAITSSLIRHTHTVCVSKKTILPRNGGYKGTLFLLISGLTFSAAESFAIDLKEGAQAILVGRPTAGDTGNGPRSFKTKNHVRFRTATRQASFSAQGFPLEGKSIDPHYYVAQTHDDFLEGNDAALDFIISIIEQGKY